MSDEVVSEALRQQVAALSTRMPGVTPEPVLWRDSQNEFLAWLLPAADNPIDHRYGTVESMRCIAKILVPRPHMKSDLFGPLPGLLALDANYHSPRIIRDTPEVLAAHIAFKMGVAP